MRGRIVKAIFALSGIAVAAAGAHQLFGSKGNDDAFETRPVTRRLSDSQYRYIIADVFGPDIVIAGRFEPEARKDGLLAIGESQVSISQAGFEQYRAAALSVASQVVDKAHRDILLPCKPAAENTADATCAGMVIAELGPLLYRRSLSPPETQALVDVAGEAAAKLGSFYSGLEVGIATALVSPKFLFRKEVVVPVAGRPGEYQLDAFSKASRLSFFLWNSAPDRELLDAAAGGDLDSSRGAERQVTRMLTSERLSRGVRAFFTDMLAFDEFSNVAKDPLIYPKYSAKVAADVPEQSLRTIVDHLLVRRGDYRDLFTTRRTFLTRELGALYGVPVTDSVPNGFPSRWIAYEYPAGDPRAGLLVQAGFAALHSHPGRSSPTLRGRALRELLLCQKIPDPPNDVSFAVVQDTDNPAFKTARARLSAHLTAPSCAGCHKLTDPIGLALEQFDSAAGFRASENGEKIDPSGDLDGVRYADAVALGAAMHDNPATTSCVVNRMYAYATGQTTPREAAALLGDLEKNFAKAGYRIPDLMRDIATHPSFYRVDAPRPQNAAADNQQGPER